MTALTRVSDFTNENLLARSSLVASVFPVFLAKGCLANEEPPAHAWVFSYRAEYAGTPIRISIERTGDMVVDTYRPRTELGMRLLSLRRAYVEGGGQLLDADALDEEISSRRGGVSDA